VGVGGAFGALAAACVLRFLPAGVAGPRVPLDAGGGLLLALGLALLLLGISGPGAASTAPTRVALLAAGAAILSLWGAWEGRHPSPLVDVRLLMRRAVWPVNVAGAAIGAGMYALGFLVPQLVQADPETTGVGFGASVSTTSLYLLPALVAGPVAGVAAGMIGRQRGSALPLLLGLAAMASGYVALAAGLDWPLVVAAATLAAHGVGLNLALAAMANLIVEGAPGDRTAEAAGVNTTIRTIGGAIGIQVVAIVLVAPSAHGERVSEQGFALSFAICGALIVGAITLLAAMGLAPRRRMLTSHAN
jgi:hypothetical protein